MVTTSAEYLLPAPEEKNRENNLVLISFTENFQKINTDILRHLFSSAIGGKQKFRDHFCLTPCPYHSKITGFAMEENVLCEKREDKAEGDESRNVEERMKRL